MFDLTNLPLLHDFRIFLKYIHTEKVQLSRNGHLKLKDLYTLNQLMTVPEPRTSPRSRPASYPKLHLFLYLAWDAALVDADQRRNRMRLQLTDRCNSFLALAPEDQYLAILQMLWIDLRWYRLFGSQIYLEAFSQVLVLLNLLPINCPIPFQKLSYPGFIYLKMLDNFVQYLEYLGWIRLKLNAKRLARNLGHRQAAVDHISLTPLGAGMLEALALHRPIHRWNTHFGRFHYGIWDYQPGQPQEPDDYSWLDRVEVKAVMVGMTDHLRSGEHKGQEQPPEYKQRIENLVTLLNARKDDEGESDAVPQTDPDSTDFTAVLAPLVNRTGLHTLPLRDIHTFIPGVYTFKVNLNEEVWRTIVIGAEHTAHDLHQAILEAYEVPHSPKLYAFFLDNVAYSEFELGDPSFEQDGLRADHVRIGALDLKMGQSIDYLLDFGMSWHFEVTLSGFDGVTPPPPKPYTETSIGDPPRFPLQLNDGHFIEPD